MRLIQSVGCLTIPSHLHLPFFPDRLPVQSPQGYGLQSVSHQPSPSTPSSLLHTYPLQSSPQLLPLLCCTIPGRFSYLKFVISAPRPNRIARSSGFSVPPPVLFVGRPPPPQSQRGASLPLLIMHNPSNHAPKIAPSIYPPLSDPHNPEMLKFAGSLNLPRPIPKITFRV